MKARLVACCAIVLTFSACLPLLPIAQTVLNAAQWVGSVIEVADNAQKTWFDLNPNQPDQLKVYLAIARARKALAALNGIAVAAESLDQKDLVAARSELIAAYKDVEAVFASLDVPLRPGMKAMEPPRVVESARIEAALLPR